MKKSTNGVLLLMALSGIIGVNLYYTGYLIGATAKYINKNF